MPFVKLDCGILNSTLWLEREARDVFITALLMAEPIELSEPTPQIAIGGLDLTGWIVPPGWYGFVPAASVGILHRAKVPDEVGMLALARLGNPEDTSRSTDFEGRRLVRVNGGFIVLNYMKYRDRDYTSAERSKRYRERVASRRSVTASQCDITQAEAEAEVRSESLVSNNKLISEAGASTKESGGGASVTKRKSRKPRFTTVRFAVFDWMHFELLGALGSSAEEFDLDTWYRALDEKISGNGATDTAWPWLKQRTLREARERGLTIESAASITQQDRPPTKAERDHARRIRANHFGCDHKPRCESEAACVDLAVRQLRART